MAGVKGRSGRKTIREEFKAMKEAEKIFFDDHDQDAIEKKITSGRFSIKDRLILNAMEGDTATVLKAYHKAVPDMIEGTVDTNLTITFDPTFNAPTREAEGDSTK